MGKLFWVICMGPKIQPPVASKKKKKKAEDDLTQKRRRQCDHGGRLEGCGPQTKECQLSPEAGRSKDTFSPGASKGSCSPADTLIPSQ